MLRQVFVAAAMLYAISAAVAATKVDDPARPRDATANQPSESGAQSTTPKGAVTGAGQPQAGAQPESAKSADSAKTKAGKSGKPESKSTKQKRKKKEQ
jgi:hypothetical protein